MRIRRLAARGVVVNGTFDVAPTSLGLLRGLVVAAWILRAAAPCRCGRGARPTAGG